MLSLHFVIEGLGIAVEIYVSVVCSYSWKVRPSDRPSYSGAISLKRPWDMRLVDR